MFISFISIFEQLEIIYLTIGKYPFSHLHIINSVLSLYHLINISILYDFQWNIQQSEKVL